MPASTKNPGGPLTQAAAALESELRRYEETAAELDKVALTSEKTLQRARKVLEECAAHQSELALLLPAFAQAMQAAQAKQQACMELTARGTARIKERFEARMALLERVAALGQRAQDINGPVAAVMDGDAERTPAELLKSLEEVAGRTEAVIAEASEVHAAAETDDWQDIARDTDALKQQLQSARNKLLVAQRSVAERAPS
ncbi:MAG: hypothetical protein KIT84_25585 [Labilithrix sp.]|nr:hypothetical protein [Labilithrix sp.]MCW5814425.1 hypothetical protein [Labilithrix sp.]